MLSLSLSDSWAGAQRWDTGWHVLCESLQQEPDWSHVIDVQLKAIKVFCLLVNIPFSRPVRAAPKPRALRTGPMVGLKSVLAHGGGVKGGPVVPLTRCPLADPSRSQHCPVTSCWGRLAKSSKPTLSRKGMETIHFQMGSFRALKQLHT